MAKFITIDDLIISADLSDLKVLRYPGPSLVSFPQHKNDSPGQFTLRVTNLDHLEHTCLIPALKTNYTDFLGRRYFTPDGYARSFNMAIYKGSPNDKATWEEVSRFGGCLFDIAADWDELIRFQKEQARPLRPEGEPEMHLLHGTFREYRASNVCWDGFESIENAQVPPLRQQEGPLLDFGGKLDFLPPIGPKDDWEYLP